MRTLKRKAMPFMICISMIFAVSCQTVQQGASHDHLVEVQEKASQNRLLNTQITSLRNEMRAAQYRGDYYAAADIRKELNAVQAKLAANGGKVSQEQDLYESDYYGNSRYRSSVDLLERTNANSTYANGELTTSSRMLRSAQ